MSLNRSDDTDLNNIDGENKQGIDDEPIKFQQEVEQDAKPSLQNYEKKKKSKASMLLHKESEKIKSTKHGSSVIASAIYVSITAQDKRF